jgi:hypothetical protein
MTRRRVLIAAVVVAVLACLALAVFGNQYFGNAVRCPEGTVFSRTYETRHPETGLMTGGGIICVTTEGEEVRIPYR